jgi:hypothetical protein
MYLNKQFVTFKGSDVRHLISMLNLVQNQQAQYTIARDDVVAYVLAQGSSEYVEQKSAVCGLILYDQLFQEIKTLLI